VTDSSSATTVRAAGVAALVALATAGLAAFL
jgi:hypothetical protein